MDFGLPAAIDIVDDSVRVSAWPRSGSVFPVGTTEVRFTATDGSGNVATHAVPLVVGQLGH